jgi:hypothetical protein
LRGSNDQIWALDSMTHSNPLIKSIAGAIGVEKETVIQCRRSSLYRLWETHLSRLVGNSLVWRSVD